MSHESDMARLANYYIRKFRENYLNRQIKEIDTQIQEEYKLDKPDLDKIISLFHRRFKIRQEINKGKPTTITIESK